MLHLIRRSLILSKLIQCLLNANMKIWLEQPCAWSYVSPAAVQKVPRIVLVCFEFEIIDLCKKSSAHCWSINFQPRFLNQNFDGFLLKQRITGILVLIFKYYYGNNKFELIKSVSDGSSIDPQTKTNMRNLQSHMSHHVASFSVSEIKVASPVEVLNPIKSHIMLMKNKSNNHRNVSPLTMCSVTCLPCCFAGGPNYCSWLFLILRSWRLRIEHYNAQL